MIFFGEVMRMTNHNAFVYLMHVISNYTVYYTFAYTVYRYIFTYCNCVID